MKHSSLTVFDNLSQLILNECFATIHCPSATLAGS